MAYYDEVIERNKRYLTNAQVNALVAASQEYNIQNAGNRAGALASAREQYDTGYRGLQNMGLAGAMSGAPTSGEVPRLQTQIQAPFDAYNNRLRQVENQRLNAMGGMMAEQTRQARAAAAAQQAAAKAAQEEAMRQAQLRAAAEIQTMKNDKPSVARVINNNRPSGAKGITSEDLNMIKRYDEPYTEPEKPATRAQTMQNTLAEGVNQAVTINPQVIAAAKVLGISSPANKAVNKVEQSLSPILNQKTGVAHTDDERQAANQILQATKDMNKGYDKAEAKQQFEAAQKKVDAMDEAMSTGAWDVPDDVYRQAVAQRDVAKLKAEDPVTYSFLVVANSDLDAVTKKKAGQQFVDKAFTDDKDDAAQKFRSAQETVNRMEAELAKEQKEKEKASEDKKNMKEQVGTALYNLDAAKESGDTNKIHEARKALYAITDPNTGRGFDEQSARSWYWVGDTEEPKLDEDKYKYYKSMLDIIDSDHRTPEDKALLENAPDDFSESKAREYVSWFESETAPKQEAEKLRQAKETLAAAELRYKYPDAYKAMQIYQYRDLLKKSNPDIVEWADEKIADYRMQEMGLKAPAMTDEEYTAAKKDAKGIQNALRRIENAQSAYDNAGEAETEDVVSDKEHAKNDLDAAVREMQEKYGMTKEEAEAFMERFETEKDARMENDYYRPGMIALLEHQGETPTNAVNRNEIDQTYRMVNDLPWMAFDENEGSNYTSTVKWMTQEQKDAYNAIYEKDGIDAANQYFKDITPYLNIQRAQHDEEHYKQFADEHPLLADVVSVGANLLWNAPATMERLLVGAENALGGSKYYDVNSDWSFRSGRADIIRSERSQNILSNMSRPEWVNNVLNFAYQTGMSMADSGVAMAFAYAGQEWMVDALFFSSAGNAAYKEAKERGATQQQAMEIGILSGAAEAIFEHASIEHFMRMDYKGKGALVKNLLSQATAEGSEEVSTEIANILTDVWVMRDKSQYAQAVKDYKSQGMSDEQAQNRAFMDQLASIGMAGFGGAVSGALFGLGGAAVSSVKFNKEGKRLNSNTQAKERVIQLAEIMGGKAQESLDAYNADKTDRNLGELSATVQQNMLDMFGKGKEAPDVSKDTALEMNAGYGKQVDLDAAVRDQIIDKATAYSAMLSGDRMSTATAKAIMDVLGKELLNDMGYNTSSSQKFASSYNQRLDQYGIQSRADAMAGFSFRQRGSYLSSMQRTPSVMGAVRAGSALTQAQERYTTTKNKAEQVTQTEEATTRVWKDPNLGYVEREDGKLVKGLPGNMTSVPHEEQKKNKFAARITAKAGRATYAMAGMEALESLSNEQKISELKKNMTKEALGKAEFLEQLAPAMKLDMVIHDDLGAADGYVDDNGVLHISLSSKKSILRVTSHELLHEIRQVSEEHYQAIKDAIIEQVGQEEFDKKVAQKAEEYRKAGVTLSQNGAEEETIAEYSERMLSDTDWLEDFVEKNPDAARTLGDVLLKIINAIKKAFKRIENRNYGTSWSQEIEYTQDTLQAMYDGLEAVMARKETKAEVSTDRRIADETKATERATEQAAQAEADELYRSADDIRAEEAKKAAEESAKKKTYVPGFKAAEVERVLEAGVFGDKSNYEGDDYEQARAMIAQLIPDMVSLLKKEGDIDAVVEKTKAVVGKMLDNYFEDEGDMAALREAIPSVIGVDSTAKTDLKAQDTSLFQMSAKLSKALGHPVTLVSEQNAKGQKNAKYSSAEKLEEVWERVRDQFGLSDDQDFSIDTTRLLDFIEQQADTRKTFNDLYGKQRQEIIKSTAVDILQAVKDMYSEKTGQKFSLDTDAMRKAKESMYPMANDDLDSAETYSYEHLTSMKPIGVVAVGNFERLQTNGRFNKELVASEGLKNAEVNGERLSDGVAGVKNVYTGRNLQISKRTIKHGLDGKFPKLSVNSNLGSIIGSLAKNAIPINGLVKLNPEAEYTYVMAAIGNNGERNYLALMHVDSYNNQVRSVFLHDVVHSLNGKVMAKGKQQLQREAAPHASNELTTGTVVYHITIADMLDIVNDLHPDVLSEDVLQHYGYTERPAGDYNGDEGVKFSIDTDAIRDSGFNLKNSVEGYRDLLAVHNLSGDQLEKSLERGGFPMPSIAVLKQSQGHDRYGDVSVIFGKDTIDPQKSSANKVYGGDAWTPSYPTIEYKPRKAIHDRITKTYYDLSRKYGSDAARPLYNYVYDIERQLNNAQSEKALLEKLYNDTDLMQLYGQTVGKERVDDVYKETRKEMTENDRVVPQFFISELGEDFIRKYEVPKGEKPLDYRREFIKRNRAELERAFGKMLRETFSFEQAENILDQTDSRQYNGILRRALKILDNDTVEVERVYDSEATKKAIRNNIDQKAYQGWVYDLFHGIIEKSGIRNNKGYYTNTGNPRSWDALHDEDTLENVVRVMRQMADKGEAAFFSQSEMLALGTRDFKSIGEIRKHKGQLQHITDEEMSAAKSSIVERFGELMDEMRDKRERNEFIARDRALQAMVEAVKKSKTPAGIQKELEQWHGLNVTNDMGQRIADLVQEIADLPTEYFEAKPKRAVSADEIKAVVLPEGKYIDLEADLAKRGIPVITYEYENAEDRLRALNSAEVSQYLFSLDTDAAREARQAFTVIDTAGIEDGLEALKNVKNVGAFAMKDISRFLDAISHSSKDEEANKNLRNTLSAIFEKPHSEATGRYARGVERMQQRVLDIGAKAGVCDEKGGHFDSKKSAAIQNIGEGFSNTYTDLKLKVKDADRVTVRAYEPGTDKLVVSEKDYTLKELRQAYGTNAADFVWSRVFDETQKAQATGKESGWLEETVNTRPYTLADLQDAFPNDWQKLKTAADEFRQMYDEYIRDQNSMLRTIYPIASEYDSVEKVEKAISKKQERIGRREAETQRKIEEIQQRIEQRIAARKEAADQQADFIQKKIESVEAEMATKKRTDTKAFRELQNRAFNLFADKENAISDAAEYEAVKRAELQALKNRLEEDLKEYKANIEAEVKEMNKEKAEMQNAVQSGESLKRMHRLQYRSDYFHHFQEMASGVQNLKAIFTNNTDISPAIVGKSENTKAKSRWAGYYQQRMGADYTADAMNGMLRYGQLAEYKLAFDPLVSYLRNVTEQIRTLDDNTNRDGLIKYLMAWTDNIAGKSHRLDRLISDAGMAPRKAMQVLNWINSRVIQNTLLFNMRSSLIQISNITNAKGIVTNNLDWFNGLRCWAAASKGNEAMQAIMAQSNFLASRYMDNMELTDSALKSAKKFAGWMLGALDEVSAKATWWAAYTQYQRNPNAKVIQNAYRTYDNAIDYADDVTRRTHAGRGVGELAPAMTSRVINFVAPFQVEINNTFEQFKDNVKRRNYLGLLSTGLSVFLFNAAFEAIVGSSPLQFDFIRAVLDILLGFKNDDPDEDDDDYGLLQAWQRIAGEGIGSLPFAGQLVSIIGEDTAKKIFGEDNDATRYGNTQIGVSAVTNAGKGLYDIGKNLIEGKNVKQVNWISDLDDLVNLTLPMGGKQLTRSIQGLYTVAQGYGGKNDKEGKEQVQFVTDQDILHYIHAGLFGKWALTEASEYFGEERLLPKLFGEYEGPKSSIGKPVDANEYKAALAAGIDGKDYFSLKYDLKEYTTQAGKRSEMMEQSFTPEQKAKLDALLFGSKDAEMKTEGAVVYQKSGDDWKVKADYTNQDMFDLSQAGDKVYTGTLEAIDKTGLPQDQAVLAASIWDQAKEADDSKTEFRNLLRDNQNLTVAQKEALDLQYCGNKYPADYSDPDLYELSLDSNRSTYEKAKQAKSQGVSVKTFTGLNDKKKAYEGDGQATYMRGEIMKTNLSVKQKELLDDLLVSDKGSNPDYSSQAWFDVSMLGNGQYQEAKEGAKIGLAPETYLSVYNKWKTIDAKNENGKTVNGLKKKRAKEYLDSLTISAPVYDYIWTVVFGYKK